MSSLMLATTGGEPDDTVRLLAPFDPYATDPLVSLEPPSAAHWFGTGIFLSGRFSLGSVLCR